MRTNLRRMGLVLVLSVTAISCGSKNAPRRDLVLILAETPPSAQAAPTFDALLETSLVFKGPLRRAGSTLPIPFDLGLRIEVFTGRFDKEHQRAIWQDLPTLGEAARLSGRHAFGLAAPGGITIEDGFDEFHTPQESKGLTLVKTPGELAAAYSDAVQALDKRAERKGFERGRLFVVADMGSGATAGDLGAFLQAIGDADVAVYFTDPAASTRLVLSAPALAGNTRDQAVDPRDLYPTLAHIARIPPPGVLQGTDLVP